MCPSVRGHGRACLLSFFLFLPPPAAAFVVGCLQHYERTIAIEPDHPAALRLPVPAALCAAGRCPGALAAALARLAAGVAESAGPTFRADLRLRLLALFSDFALILPNEGYLRDLGSLLPAVAAVAAVPPVLESRASLGLSAAEMSLGTLQAMQEHDLLLLRLVRLLWLYVGIYDFAGLVAAAAGVAPRWPPAWRASLGQVAATSPLLALGMEQQRGVDLQEQLQSEFGSRLTKLGQRGTLAVLTAQLTALAGPAGPPLSAPLTAHLLTIATKVQHLASLDSKAVTLACLITVQLSAKRPSGDLISPALPPFC